MSYCLKVRFSTCRLIVLTLHLCVRQMSSLQEAGTVASTVWSLCLHDMYETLAQHKFLYGVSKSVPIDFSAQPVCVTALIGIC